MSRVVVHPLQAFPSSRRELLPAAGEAEAIHGACGSEFLVVSPGIRLAGGARHDQARIATPAEAVRAGVDALVIGRAVTAADDPGAGCRRPAGEVAGAGA